MMMTDEQIKAYTNAFAKATKLNPIVWVTGQARKYIINSSSLDETYEVLLGPDKTLDGAKCECDETYLHISCYHRAAAFNYYVDHVLYTKLATGWETIIRYEDEGKPQEFIDSKQELYKKQLEKYETLCKWRKQFINNKPKTNKVKGQQQHEVQHYDTATSLPGGTAAAEEGAGAA